MTERALFGGAMVCSMPPDWTDLSNIRQVPDQQECWQDGYGRLLVVEILEYQGDVPDQVAAKYFHDDLAEANGMEPNSDQVSFSSLEPNIAIAGLPPNASVRFGIGLQRVAMGREFDVAGNRRDMETRWIRVELCVIRLPSVQSDLLLTLSTPTESNLLLDTAVQASELFRAMLSSFQVRDWSLFG